VIKVADNQQAFKIQKRRTCARLEPNPLAAVHRVGMGAGVDVLEQLEMVMSDVIERDR
jgi:hypothetical protein